MELRKRIINPLLINSFDRGGAFIACRRLHEGLVRSGIESKVLLREKRNNYPGSFSFENELKALTTNQKIKSKIDRILNEFKFSNKEPSVEQLFLSKRSNCLDRFSFPNSNYRIENSKLFVQANIINLHWVAGFLDYLSFFKNCSKPIVWTLHDMWAFTGGEHYNEEHLGITQQGKPKLRALSDEELKISNRNLDYIAAALNKDVNLTIVAPSVWMANEAKKSKIFNKRKVLHIPNGIDSSIFKPRDKEFSKAILNIPRDKKAILFVADNVKDNRKGFAFLQRAFQKITEDKYILCAIGKLGNHESKAGNIYELGHIYDERLMSIAYSAAEVFVIPSLMDNLPNTVLESLMCGTPVIGFPVGGIPEMIEDGKNGYLAEEISVDALAEVINKFIINCEYLNRDAIWKDAVRKYSQEQQANAYSELFKAILQVR
jgi:glycosyltransferase involved in cell wall biosynthesis